MDQARNAGANRNFQLQLSLLLEAKQKDDTKEVRSRISETYGNLAVTRGDAVQALEDFEAAVKICRSCFNANMNAYMVKLKQYISDQATTARNQQAAVDQAAQAKAIAGQRANSTVASSRDGLSSSIAAAQANQQSANASKIAASDSRTQSILNGSAAQQQAAQQKAAAGPLLASDSFFGKKSADTTDPNSPYHLAPGTQPLDPNKPRDTNTLRSLGATAGSSAAGAGEVGSGSDPTKDIGSTEARKTIDTTGSASDSVSAPSIPTPSATPVLTAAQSAQLNSRLTKNAEYQKLIADHAQAAKDVAKANQAVNELTAKYDAMPEGSAKAKAALDLANASQEQARTQSALVTNETKQNEIKQEEVDIIMLPPAPKKKPVEPPLPALPPQ
jgi:hypothetical protein